MRLRGHEVLDERVCGLSVERERVLQRLQLVRLGHVGDLETCTRRGYIGTTHVYMMSAHRYRPRGSTA